MKRDVEVFAIEPGLCMHRLLDVGFRDAGYWRLEDDRLVLQIDRRFGDARDVLYAFICDGQVMYIGKTNRTLAARMANYRSPGSGQSTNIGNHRRIVELLRSDAAVAILVLQDSGLMHYGPFHLNLAAGLEDSLIRVIDPPWNGGAKEIGEAATQAAQAQDSYDAVVAVESATEKTHEPIESAAAPGPVFNFRAQPTYRARGFFNVPKAADALIGSDGESIEIRIDQAEGSFVGRISRRDNLNGTPRIHVGHGLQCWFAAATAPLQEIDVEVLSPRLIHLRPR